MNGAQNPLASACYGMTSRLRPVCTRPQSVAPVAAKGLTCQGNLMKAFRLSLLALAVAMPALATPALATPVPLPKEKHINDELRAGFAGDILRKTCPSISARMFVVMGRLYDLKSYAEAQGYSPEDWDAFRSDKAQKARLKAEAEAYLEKAGAKPGDVESYCQVGRDEIAKNTALGQLIRSSR